MSPSISQKLILSFLGLTLLVLVATLGLARWSFERGFLDYVNALEEYRLERISNDLALQYVEANKNWRSLSSQLLAESLQSGLRGRPPDLKPRFSAPVLKLENEDRAHRPSPNAPFPPPGDHRPPPPDHAFPPPDAPFPPHP